MSGETLQALATVFDIDVPTLQAPMPSEEQLRATAEEAQKRYAIIALTRVERASDLQPHMGADAYQVDHVSGLQETQEDEIACLEELLRDYGDLWSDLEPTNRRDALKTVFERVEVLTASGLLVAIGTEHLRLKVSGSEVPVDFAVQRVIVSKAEHPQMFALREKDKPVKFS